MNTTTDTATENADPVKVKPFHEALPCVIPDKERLARATKAGGLRADARKRRAEMDMALDHAKAKAKKEELEIEKLEADSDELLLQATDGVEMREVRCERRFNYRLGKVEEVRLDTQKVINERPMTDLERQVDLALPDSDKGESDTAGASENTELEEAIETIKNPNGKGDTKVFSNGKQVAGPGYGDPTDENPSTEAVDRGPEPELATSKGKGGRGKGRKGKAS